MLAAPFLKDTLKTQSKRPQCFPRIGDVARGELGMTAMASMARDASKPSLIESVEQIALDAPQDGVSLRDLTSMLGDRAFGAALFVLALPCCIPFLYIVPQIVALPMAVLAAQMALGRPAPWLPEKFAERRISKDALAQTARGGRRYFGWAEAIA
ncbi:MAG: exopolysaccharide biosynthesis protein, partial [Pseudomonadota bacterium]